MRKNAGPGIASGKEKAWKGTGSRDLHRSFTHSHTQLTIWLIVARTTHTYMEGRSSGNRQRVFQSASC